MTEFAVVVKGGDLEDAKRTLEGLGFYLGRITSTRYDGSPEDHENLLLHLHVDADDEGDVEGLFLAASTPKESEIIRITALGEDED